MANILTPRKFKNLGFENEIPPKKKLFKDILTVSLPAAAETFLVGLVGLIDTIMVGALGTAAIASVSITQQPVFITLTFCAGLAAGIIAVVSRRVGQKDRDGANRALRQTLLIGLFIATIVTILSIGFGRPFLKLAGAKHDTIDDATIYFKIVSSVLVLNYLRIIMLAGQRAAGNTRMTLITNILANTINIFLNYVLITGKWGFPALGVKGAAIATAIGNAVAFVVAFFAIYRSKKFITLRFREDWRFDSDTLDPIIRISANAFVEQIFFRIGFFLISIIVNNLGTEAVAINAITSSVISISFNVVDGFAIGAAAFVGKFLGEEKPDVAYAYGAFSQIICLVIGIIMVVLVILLRIPLSAVFSNDEFIISESGRLLLFASIVILPQSLQWVTTVILRAAGDSKYTARGTMYSVTIVRPIFSYLLCYPLGLGLLGAWLGMFIDQTFRLVFNLRRFIKLEWIYIQV